jgi:Rod binding domain-containing protein
VIGALSSTAGILTTGSAAKRDDPGKVLEAAQQFESLLIAQVLKTAREAGSSGWLGTGEDQAGALGLEVAEQEFARLLATRGGFGLSKMIAAGLERAQAVADGATTATAPSAPVPPDSVRSRQESDE